MKKHLSIIYIIICVFGCCWLQAQSNDTANALIEINQIKRSPDRYFFAEATSKNWEEALDNAKILLTAQLESWAKHENDTIEGYLARANEHLFQIKAMRGQLYRAFVYVARTDLLPISSQQEIMIVPVDKNTGPTIELVQVASSIRPDVEKERTEPQDTIPHSVPMTEKKDKEVSAQNKLEEAPKTDYQLTVDEQKMLDVQSFNGINDFIRRLYSIKKVKDYGNHADMPEDCYLFIHNHEGNILAYLHKTGDTFFNLKTKQSDSLFNYKGCSLIWYQLR